MRRAGLAGVLAALAAAAGCGYAVGSGAARLPAGAASVFVPPLENRTADAEAGALVAADVVTIAVQVNGKLRGEVLAPVSAGEAEVRAMAEQEERVKAHLVGKTVRKVVFVPRRLINFVVT